MAMGVGAGTPSTAACALAALAWILPWTPDP